LFVIRESLFLSVSWSRRRTIAEEETKGSVKLEQLDAGSVQWWRQRQQRPMRMMTTPTEGLRPGWTRLYIVRHAEHVTPALAHLSGKGSLQAVAIANTLKGRKVSAVYSSPRSYETAQNICKELNLKVELDKRLLPYNSGALVGLSMNQVKERMPEVYRKRFVERNPDFRVPEGESLNDRFRRVKQFMNDVVHLHKGQQVVVVTHGGIIDDLFRNAHSLPPSQLTGLKKPYGSLSVLLYRDGTFEEEVWGGVSHLPEVVAMSPSGGQLYLFPHQVAGSFPMLRGDLGELCKPATQAEIDTYECLQKEAPQVARFTPKFSGRVIIDVQNILENDHALTRPLQCMHGNSELTTVDESKRSTSDDAASADSGEVKRKRIDSNPTNLSTHRIHSDEDHEDDDIEDDEDAEELSVSERSLDLHLSENGNKDAVDSDFYGHQQLRHQAQQQPQPEPHQMSQSMLGDDPLAASNLASEEDSNHTEMAELEDQDNLPNTSNLTSKSQLEEQPLQHKHVLAQQQQQQQQHHQQPGESLPPPARLQRSWSITSLWSRFAGYRKKKVVEVEPGKLVYLVLEDLTHGLIHPHILDLKMGIQQHNSKESAEKKAKKQKRVESTTSKSVGVRIGGMQTYDDIKRAFVLKDKYWGRSLDQDGLDDALLAFVVDKRSGNVRVNVVNDIIVQLSMLEQAVKTTPWRFYGCSVLIVYDSSDPQARRDRLSSSSSDSLTTPSNSPVLSSGTSTSENIYIHPRSRSFDLIPVSPSSPDAEANEKRRKGFNRDDRNFCVNVRLIDFAKVERHKHGDDYDEGMVFGLTNLRKIFSRMLISQPPCT